MKSNIEWEKWGERDPLYAVATWAGKERGAPNAWTDDEFYEIGRSDWADFLKQWQHYGLAPGVCVEIGCGAGRITKQLSEHFHQVNGLDVSQHQLDYARKHISASNVSLTFSNGTAIPLSDCTCDAAFSVHVFQHFECFQDALAVFQEIFRTLKPGGTLMIHLPLYDLPDTKLSQFFSPIISLDKRLSDMRAAIGRRQLLKGKWTPIMRRLRFDRNQLRNSLRGIGYCRIEFRSFEVLSNQSYHEFVFATKRNQPLA